jgi:hypothetical protein
MAKRIIETATAQAAQFEVMRMMAERSDLLQKRIAEIDIVIDRIDERTKAPEAARGVRH